MLFSMIKIDVIIIRHIGIDDREIQYNYIYFQ